MDDETPRLAVSRGDLWQVRGCASDTSVGSHLFRPLAGWLAGCGLKVVGSRLRPKLLAQLFRKKESRQYGADAAKEQKVNDERGLTLVPKEVRGKNRDRNEAANEHTHTERHKASQLQSVFHANQT